MKTELASEQAVAFCEIDVCETPVEENVTILCGRKKFHDTLFQRSGTLVG